MNALLCGHQGVVHRQSAGNLTICGRELGLWQEAPTASAFNGATFLDGQGERPGLCADCYPDGQIPAEEGQPEFKPDLYMRPLLVGEDGQARISGFGGWIGPGGFGGNPEANALAEREAARDAARARREREERLAALEEKHAGAAQARGGARTPAEIVAGAAVAMDSADRWMASQEKKHEQRLLAGEIPDADPALIAAAERRQKMRESRANVAALQAERETQPVTHAEVEQAAQGARKSAFEMAKAILGRH